MPGGLKTQLKATDSREDPADSETALGRRVTGPLRGLREETSLPHTTHAHECSRLEQSVQPISA